MKDNRCVSKEFLEELSEGGLLRPFVEKVKDSKNGIQLCFRGNNVPETVTIYYNNHVVWRIKSQKNGFRVEVSANHAKGEKKEKLLKELERLGFITKSNTAKDTPFITKKTFDERFVDLTYELMTGYIRDYFGVDSGKEKLIEKKRQHKLFDTLTDSKDGLYVYDLEFHQKYESKEAKDKEGKQNEPDMLAIRFEEGTPKALVMIEVKSTTLACKNECGIIPHIEGMKRYIRSPYYINRISEAEDVINAYIQLGIHNPPSEFSGLKDIKPEIALILTDEAISYYEHNADFYEEYKKDCDFYVWSEKEGIAKF